MAINWNKRFAIRDNIQHESEHWIKHYAKLQKTHDDFLALRARLLYDNTEVKKLPHYMRSELYGYFEALYKTHVLNHLIFVYQWTDNNWYTTKELDRNFSDFNHAILAKMVREAEQNGKNISSFAWDNNHLF